MTKTPRRTKSRRARRARQRLAPQAVEINSDHPQFRNAIPDRAKRCDECGGFSPCGCHQICKCCGKEVDPELPTSSACAARHEAKDCLCFKKKKLREEKP